MRQEYAIARLRGRVGRIARSHGLPYYEALEVRFEDGNSWLFWHHELEEAEEHEIPGGRWWRRVFRGGWLAPSRE